MYNIICTVLQCYDAYQTIPWGGPGPRFEPGTGGLHWPLDHQTSLTRPPHFLVSTFYDENLHNTILNLFKKQYLYNTFSMIQKSGLVKFCYEGYMNPDFFVDVPILMYYWNIHIDEEGANVSIYTHHQLVLVALIDRQLRTGAYLIVTYSVLAPEKWV